MGKSRKKKKKKKHTHNYMQLIALYCTDILLSGVYVHGVLLPNNWSACWYLHNSRDHLQKIHLTQITDASTLIL